MKQWGLCLMVLAGLSFVLPYVGMQFQIFSLFGEAQDVAVAGAAILGLVLFVLGSAVRGKEDDGEREVEVEQEPASRKPPTIRRKPTKQLPRPPVETSPPFCTSCGAAIAATDQFCSSCGARVQEPVARNVSARQDEAPKRHRNGSLVGLAIVALLGLSAYYIVNRPDEDAGSAPTTAPVVPSEADLAQLRTWRDEAERAWRALESSSDRETRDRRAQEFVHLKTALRHAERMRDAWLEARRAREADDPVGVQAAMHGFRHYRGELSLMLPHAHPRLAAMIRRWLEA